MTVCTAIRYRGNRVARSGCSQNSKATSESGARSRAKRRWSPTVFAVMPTLAFLLLVLKQGGQQCEHAVTIVTQCRWSVVLHPPAQITQAMDLLLGQVGVTRVRCQRACWYRRHGLQKRIIAYRLKSFGRLVAARHALPEAVRTSPHQHCLVAAGGYYAVVAHHRPSEKSARRADVSRGTWRWQLKIRCSTSPGKPVDIAQFRMPKPVRAQRQLK